MEPFVCGVVTVLFLLIGNLQGRLGALERKLDRLCRHLGLDPVPPLSERVKALAQDPRQKIAAIKAYREESGAGLKEAKDAVEAYLAGTGAR